MVKYIFALLFLTVSLNASAQSKKLTLFCRVTNRGFSRVDVDFLQFVRILPDSIKNSQLIQPKKGNNVDVVLIRMSMMGWKIITAEGNFGTTYPASYLLCKEVDISETEKANVAKRLDQQ